MSPTARHFASMTLTAASRLLPRRLAPWSAAMQRELAEIEQDREALAFAAGCLRAVLGLAIAARLQPLWAAVRFVLFATTPPSWRLPSMNPLSARPRLLGLVCAIGAVGMGIAYMTMAGAPPRCLLVNLAALVLGATAWLALGGAARTAAGAGAATLALAVPLLLTALLGVPVEGAARWVNFGALSVQVSLVVLPVMVVLYARRPDAVGTAGMVVAALALALQPDRAMAGVLLAGLVALVLARPSRLAIAATAASAAAFGYTLLTPDALPAVPFVDRILYSAFDVHPLAGAAVLVGATALVVPALLGALRATDDRPAVLAFGGCWAGVIAAAALGDYPTPLVGYGGSAVLGYLLSVALLPGGAREAGRTGSEGLATKERAEAETPSERRVPHPA